MGISLITLHAFKTFLQQGYHEFLKKKYLSLRNKYNSLINLLLPCTKNAMYDKR